MQVLKVLGRLGQSAQRCVAALEIFSAKVSKVDPSENTIVQSHQAEAELGFDTSTTAVEGSLGEFD